MTLLTWIGPSLGHALAALLITSTVTSSCGRSTEQRPDVAAQRRARSEAVIELVKRSRTLDRGDPVSPNDPRPTRNLRTNEEEIRAQLEKLKGDLRIVGWEAFPSEQDAWLVQYSVFLNGQPRTWPFEANLRAQLVRYVIGDRVLEERYGVSRDPSQDTRDISPPDGTDRRTDTNRNASAIDRTEFSSNQRARNGDEVSFQAPVRVGGAITPPAKTKDVRPTYPLEAQSRGVQGVVIIEATIGTTGKVQDARVLQSIPLLDQPALDAIRQWEFTPTVLNGMPVPVIMTVTVQFKLS
jgi:TonB family protein